MNSIRRRTRRVANRHYRASKRIRLHIGDLEPEPLLCKLSNRATHFRILNSHPISGLVTTNYPRAIVTRTRNSVTKRRSNRRRMTNRTLHKQWMSMMEMWSTCPSSPSWRRLRDDCFCVPNLFPIMFVKPKTQNGILSGKANTDLWN